MVSLIEDDVMVDIIKKSVGFKSDHSKSKPSPAKAVASESQTDFISSLNLTDTAKQIEALKAIIFNTPETNQTKIEFIKEELSTGKYQIHSDHIASKLTEYAQSLKQPEVA